MALRIDDPLPPKTVGVPDLAARWGCSTQTIYNYIKVRKILKAKSYGNRWGVSEGEVARFERKFPQAAEAAARSAK